MMHKLSCVLKFLKFEIQLDGSDGYFALCKNLQMVSLLLNLRLYLCGYNLPFNNYCISKHTKAAVDLLQPENVSVYRSPNSNAANKPFCIFYCLFSSFYAMSHCKHLLLHLFSFPYSLRQLMHTSSL